MKEINQRPTNDLLIRCNCGSDHFIDFYYFTDENRWRNVKAEKLKNKSKKTHWKHYSIGFIDSGKWSFLHKLKICLKYLFKNNYICYRDIGINSKDMNRIKKHFEKYQQL